MSVAVSGEVPTRSTVSSLMGPVLLMRRPQRGSAA